jgi:hypothetical protein
MGNAQRGAMKHELSELSVDILESVTGGAGFLPRQVSSMPPKPKPYWHEVMSSNGLVRRWFFR